MPRNLAHHLKYVNHGRTSADDSMEFEIAYQALLEAINPSLARELFGKIIDDFLKTMTFEGLWKVIVGAALDGFDRGVDGVKARHQNYINAGILAQSLLEKTQPIHHRHFQVTQNDAALASPD